MWTCWKQGHLNVNVEAMSPSLVVWSSLELYMNGMYHIYFRFLEFIRVWQISIIYFSFSSFETKFFLLPASSTCSSPFKIVKVK